MRFFLCVFILVSTLSLSAREKVCLNMIVKNESAVIKRALDSVRPFIDYWVIVDTGSTDGTQDLIKEIMGDIPGELHECPWINFGFNRMQALELAQNKADYLLFIDADDWLEYEEGYSLPPLTRDVYHMWRGNNDFSYLIPQLVKAGLSWKWVGVLHEYLTCDQPYTSETLEGVRYIQTVEGSRSSDPQKYWKHVQLLKDGLKEEPNNPRYTFYLAESYRDAGDPISAIEWYQKRAEMGGWEEEVYWSLLQIAKLKKGQNADVEGAIEAFYRAHRFRPQRVEAIYYLAELYNQIKRYDLAYECIKMRDATLSSTRDTLFNEDWIEKWGLSFQHSICSYYLGHYQESLDMCDQLLENTSLPDRFRQQVIQNRNFPIQQLHLYEKKVLLAILARNKAHTLPLFLKCIEELQYDKKLITVYINTNNNVDRTEELLKEWAAQNKEKYGDIIFERHDEPDMPDTNPHEWGPEKWKILGKIRNESLKKTKEYNCDYYFVVDCDNFIIPCTLKELIHANKPIVAPLLKGIPESNDVYSNFFADIDQKGYYRQHPDYFKIFNREKSGTFKVPVVHHVYLIKSEIIDQLSYVDESSDWEFIVFSRSARNHGIGQYICNEKDFGRFLHFHKNLTLEEEQVAFHKMKLPEFKTDIVDQRLYPHDKRYRTFKRALQLMEERNIKTIVETGTARDGDTNFVGDGGSTVLFADWANQHNAFLYSVDINEKAIQAAKQATLPFQNCIQFLQMDSISFLQKFSKKIDFLYLDSFDFDVFNPLPSQNHHLKEIEAAYDKLTDQSIVMIDDCKLPYGGKGKEVIAFLLKKGWQVIEDGYQVILTKKECFANDFLALLQTAKENEKKHLSSEIVIQGYLNAHFASHAHSEPLYYLSRYFRTIEKYEEAFQVASIGIKNSKASPIEKWIYDYGMLLEFSLCAHSTGRFKEAIEATQNLLKDPHLSHIHPTLLKNISYYQAGIQVSEFAKKWGNSPKPLSSPRIHVCTVATQSCQGLDQLLNSCKHYGIEPKIFGLGEHFTFGKKLGWIKEYLETIPDTDIVLFVDGYDTLILADEVTILDKFYSMGAPFVISTETNCHPFPHFAAYYPNSPTRFKYLNSGSYIGYVGYIKRLMEEIMPISDETDDQGLLTALYLYHPYLFKLDYKGDLFLTLYQVDKNQIAIEDQKVHSLETHSLPCVIHGNGPGKALYQYIYDQIFSFKNNSP